MEGLIVLLEAGLQVEEVSVDALLMDFEVFFEVLDGLL